MNQELLDLINLRREIDKKIIAFEKNCPHIEVDSQEDSDHDAIWVRNICKNCNKLFITKLRRIKTGY
jgi:predicted GNAT family N-acyltransferase